MTFGDELQGRELDAAIAERVFRYRREVVPADARGEHGGGDMLVPPDLDLSREPYCLPPKGPIARTFFVPEWSSRPERALELAGKMGELGFVEFAIHTKANMPQAPWRDGTWRATFRNPMLALEGSGDASDVATAIARAALAAGIRLRESLDARPRVPSQRPTND